MGASSSSIGSASADYLAEFFEQALDTSKVATLSWEQFLNYISGLNERCRNITDENGKFLLFALKKGSTDTILWRGTVRICCLKVNSHTGKVESRKMLTLPQFLRLHKSMECVIIPTMTHDQPQAGPSHRDVRALPKRSMMTTSVLLEKVGGTEIDTELEHDCIICMERKPDVILPCSHCYCLPCIEQWKEGGHHSCPICRTKIAKTDDSWVISEFPEQEELRDYFMKMAD